jgi:OFA family oxalate/formate antiporter-like MFS transporter
MFIVFIGEGLALLGLMQFGHNPYAFMTFAALIFLFWGESFSIFPALCADTFGVKNAAANAGTLYTAKGTAALLVPLGSILSAGGDWDCIFVVTAAITITAGISAKFLLAPMRCRCIAEANSNHRDWHNGMHERASRVVAQPQGQLSETPGPDAQPRATHQ